MLPLGTTVWTILLLVCIIIRSHTQVISRVIKSLCKINLSSISQQASEFEDNACCQNSADDVLHANEQDADNEAYADNDDRYHDNAAIDADEVDEEVTIGQS